MVFFIIFIKCKMFQFIASLNRINELVIQRNSNQNRGLVNLSFLFNAYYYNLYIIK